MSPKTSSRYDVRCSRCGKRVPKVLLDAHRLAEDAIDEYLVGNGLRPAADCHPVYAPHTVEVAKELRRDLQKSLPNTKTRRWIRRTKQADLFAFARNNLKKEK